MKKLIKTASPLHDMFLKNNGVLRVSEALAEGAHPRDFYALRDEGVIEPIVRGLYRLKALPPLKFPELFTLAHKIPHGVIFLTSAAIFHKLTATTTSEISVALRKGSEKPRIENLSLKFYWISEPAFSEGIETHSSEGAQVQVYSIEKTIADCFKFRNRIGLEFCIEVLRTWNSQKYKDISKLLNYAKVCRVEKIIDPYLRAFGIQ